MNRYKFLKEAHLHTLDGKSLTGTSSVSKVISIGGALSWWSAEKTVEKLGWLHPKKALSDERISTATPILEEIKKMDVKQYMSLLDLAYKNHSVRLKESAVKGTDLHEELSHFIEVTMGLYSEHTFSDKIKLFIEWSYKNVKKFLWSEKYSYSEKLWVGGISDFGAELNDGRLVIGDFKSSKEAYIQHYFQGAGYIIEIEENGLYDIDGNLVMKLDRYIDGIVIIPFGAKVVEPRFNTLSIAECKCGFKCALTLYRLLGLEEKK